MFLVLLYAGRRYYFSVLRRTFGLRAPDQIEASSVWWARVAMGAFVLFVVQLSFVGVEWQWALAYSLIVIMIFTVVSRLVAEAGAFFIHPHFYPCAMIWGFIGAKAVGVDQLLVLSMISGLLLIDPREAMMPFAATATCLTERVGAPASKTLRWGMVALVLCFVVTVPIVLCWQYQHGAVVVGDGWTTDGVPKFPYRVNSQISNTMDAQGVLADSQNASGLSRLSMASPLKPYVAAFAATFLLVLLFSFLRHRFARWPIHPLIFLMLDTFQSRMLATSFLIGCLLKAAVTHYGGATIYQKLKPPRTRPCCRRSLGWHHHRADWCHLLLAYRRCATHVPADARLTLRNIQQDNAGLLAEADRGPQALGAVKAAPSRLSMISDFPLPSCGKLRMSVPVSKVSEKPSAVAARSGSEAPSGSAAQFATGSGPLEAKVV